MTARETGAPRAASRRDRSAPRPWPVSAVATFWLSHGPGGAGAGAEAGGGGVGAGGSGETKVVIDLIQHQLLAQAPFVFAQRADPPANSSHMLADVEVDPLDEGGIDLAAKGS